MRGPGLYPATRPDLCYAGRMSTAQTPNPAHACVRNDVLSALVLAELRAGRLPLDHARECQQVSVHLFGAHDRDSLAYAYAIAEYLADEDVR